LLFWKSASYKYNTLKTNQIEELNLSKNLSESGGKRRKVAGVSDTKCDTKFWGNDTKARIRESNPIKTTTDHYENPNSQIRVRQKEYGRKER
jgi:hypothetical protein